MKRLHLYLIFAILILGLTACKKNEPLTPYNYALISAHAYERANTENLPPQIEPYLDFNPKNYEPEEDLKYKKDIQLSEDKNWNYTLNKAVNLFTMGGYFGRAYINKKNNEIIIAHRGTDIPDKDDNIDNSFASVMGVIIKTLRDVDDDIAILEGEIPPQYYAAVHFENEVKEKYKKEFSKDPVIIHTGHSLGAILAELCAAKNKSQAITFESPGSLPLIKKLLATDIIDSASFDIRIYNANPNVINSTHEQSGEVIFLSKTQNGKINPRKKLGIHIDIDSDDLKDHSIENILKMFDPQTGEPMAKGKE